MDYVIPSKVLESMIDAGAKKAKLSISQLLMRGFLGAALLGFATTLAFLFELQTNIGMLGAIIFPVGFVMIILLGFELVTGNFALIPVAVLEKKATVREMLNNWFWVIVGHLIGGIVYAALCYVAFTNDGQTFEHPLVQKIIKVAEAKTTAYEAMGSNGILVVFVKAMLCNWMVTMGAIMAMSTTSTLGKIIAMWLPITTFFGQGFEHAVVNMFVIPAGMMFGADVSLADWWLWNQIPVLVGNLASGFIFTGLAMYLIYKKDITKEKVSTFSSNLKRVSS
ncbi:formate/nitrite transporter [Neobacillus sp. B4I6]|uniref:formate/nitrite transporter family protein n=1 Tax=Neobacillus sp. B4I6 TaxID=3373925 RepID=UPI003D1FE51C